MTCYPNNDSVINAFLGQRLPSGINPGKTLWFKGTYLYSYDSLLAIIDPSAEILFIDDNIRSYSNTTAKQTAKLVGKNTYQVLSIPLLADYSEVLDFYWDKIEDRITKLIKARADHTKEAHKHWIHILLQDVETYVNYVEMDRRSSAYKRKHQITRQLFEHKIL